ncbi:TIGR03986 family CRISPR-associated RAMP protein [Candidatus Chloroploca sp. Khr17]|uniref:TIGR03986 family type III CRISPR-associated RAMP protein n=1 Tax=Candidatus Chloroploca sp. Khr17 TaxID=2496869 RepID=UPI00101CDDC1|nr:TIGR03986 family CRISPR-associated RAMP protein [Candidatus Chloroploca sp. Khr17]
MALELGKLVVRKNKNKPPTIQVEINGKLFSPTGSEISQSVLDRLAELDGQEVEFERVKGQPKQVRERGGRFVAPRQGVPADPRNQRRGHGGGGANQPQSSTQPSASGSPADFRNPYNFVPAPPRTLADPELGDQCPIDQSIFNIDRYSGWLRVRMVAQTPLLVPDTEHVREENHHKTYPLRVGKDDTPLIPASSVRGMLRSAYETITNSRFGRFSSVHTNRLAFRMSTADGLQLIPARIINGHIHLLTGTSRIGGEGKPDGPMYAAWLPRYHRNGQIATGAIRYPDRSLPKHGDEVVCWVEKIQYTNPRFFWRVRRMVRGNDLDQLGPQPEASQPHGKTAPAQPQEMRRIHGWVCITNANINRKHDERVFFQDGAPAAEPFAVTEQHKRMWWELIQNYQAIHEDELARRARNNEQPDAYLGGEPGRTAWSRHIYMEHARELTDGTLCYVRLNADQTDVEALFPVMISRELYAVAPWDLLDASLLPAASTNQLSPANRVFGWVKADADTGARDEKQVAIRGLLRVGPITCLSSRDDAVEEFAPPGVPLAILATPKPQQGRFYVAKSPKGEALTNGLSKQEAGYQARKGLRGRKVYPHQRSLPNGHWEHPTEDRTQQGLGNPAHYQEYRRPGGRRDEQNRSILGWVKPSAVFTFDLHVQNLSVVELGALLWLVDLPEEHFLRFGSGKPFGFGSVRLSIETCDVRTGAALRARYRTWHEDGPLSDPREAAVAAFKQAVAHAYNATFEKVPFINAFLVACFGHNDNLPTHYPRATADGQAGPPSPAGEAFKWFVANERNGTRYALLDLVQDRGLPTLPEK